MLMIDIIIFSGNEEALFARLHLLQAIVLYHQNKRLEALALLKKAKEEIKNLKIDEGSMLALIELGKGCLKILC